MESSWTLVSHPAPSTLNWLKQSHCIAAQSWTEFASLLVLSSCCCVTDLSGVERCSNKWLVSQELQRLEDGVKDLNSSVLLQESRSSEQIQSVRFVLSDLSKRLSALDQSQSRDTVRSGAPHKLFKPLTFTFQGSSIVLVTLLLRISPAWPCDPPNMFFIFTTRWLLCHQKKMSCCKNTGWTTAS